MPPDTGKESGPQLGKEQKGKGRMHSLKLHPALDYGLMNQSVTAQTQLRRPEWLGGAGCTQTS
jgi:hypothetical protein